MRSPQLFKHYLPVILVLFVGGFLSFFAQNYISTEARKQKFAAFNALASTSTAKLQDEKRRHIVALNTLSAAISGYSQILSQLQFDRLSAQIISDIPALKRLSVVTPAGASAHNATKVPVSPDPETNYKIIYSYPKKAVENTATINPLVRNYRALSLSNGPNTPEQTIGFLIGEIDVDIAFSTVLSDFIPAWLDIFIYRQGVDGKPVPINSFSINTNHEGLIPPINPIDIKNPFAIYHSQQLKTDTDNLSILYLPRENSFFEPAVLTRWGPLTTGLLLTLIATIYLHTLLKRSETVNSLVEVRTQELLKSANSLQEESYKRQQLVDQLSESEKQLRSVINSIDGMFWERDLANNRFNFISEHVEKLMGYTEADILKDPDLLRSRLLPEYREKFTASLESIRDENEPLQFEAQTRRADDKVIWVRMIYSVVCVNGKPSKVRGVTMDVTKYKKMGEERTKLMESITQSQQKLTSLINSIDGVLWKFSLCPPQYTYVSKQVEHFLGCTTSDILTNPYYIKDRVLDKDTEKVRQQMSSLFRQGTRSQNIEFRLVRDDGKIVYIRNIVTPVMENGEITSFHGVMLDITREKKMQEEHELLGEQLKQAQKLESIGQLAAGIAHEINTPIQFVGDNIRYLQDTFADLKHLYELYEALIDAFSKKEDITARVAQIKSFEEEIDLTYLFEDIPTSIEQSLEGTTRIRDIVKAMKEFSHPGTANKEHTDLNHAIESTIIVARNEWKYVAEMETDLAQNLPPVMLLPGEFNQVILNIIVNAAQAIDEKRSSLDSEKLGKIKIRTEQQDNSILISISDTGNGIPKEIKERVFDPFFTTKQVGKGTGQGLAIAYSVIVDKHQGKISVESTPGEGTTFHIQLPVEDQMEIPHNQLDTPAAMAS